MAPRLANWSWQDIMGVYRVYGGMLQKYNALKIRCHIPNKIDFSYSNENNLLIMRFNRDVIKIDSFVTELDREIARRNSLLGVTG